MRRIFTQSKLFSPAIKQARDGCTKIIYDGECPVCQLSVKSLSKESDIELVNARDQDNPLVQKLQKEQSLDFNKGMAVIKTDAEGNIQTTHFGAPALQKLAERKGGVWGTLFGSEVVAKATYPLLRAVRYALVGDDTISTTQSKNTFKK